VAYFVGSNDSVAIECCFLPDSRISQSLRLGRDSVMCAGRSRAPSNVNNWGQSLD
jgi:hypothetical protein